MGIDVNIYLGPIVVVPEKKLKTQGKLYCCSSVSCKNHNKSASVESKFCPLCGSANQDKITTETKSLSPYNEDPNRNFSEWYDIFCEHNVDDRIFYTTNFYLEQRGVFDVIDSEKHSEFDHDLSVIDFKANIETFKELPETKELIELLSRFYTEDEIIISYRLFKYCS